MKTIKQVAELFGMSKEQIKYLTRKLPDMLLDKTQTPHRITIEGIAVLKDLVSDKIEKKEPDIIRELSDKDALIKSLQEEVRFLRGALLREQEINMRHTEKRKLLPAFFRKKEE
jgi:DNA-binding transcriptional MerR regulator